MRKYLCILASVLVATAVVSGGYNGRNAYIAIGDGASAENRYNYALWINDKVGDATGSNAVVRVWKACARVRSIAHTNQLAWMRCVNIDRLHADGRWKNYKPDAQLELVAYQAATNIMGSDAKYVWIDVTDDSHAWKQVFERLTN